MILKNKGFTLIELLVVVAIIVVLSTLAMTSYSTANKKARNSRRKADIEQLRSALELYRTNEDHYPWSLDTLVTEKLIQSKPTDPKDPAVDYLYAPVASATCGVADDSGCFEYSLCTTLEGVTGTLCGGTYSYEMKNP